MRLFSSSIKIRSVTVSCEVWFVATFPDRYSAQAHEKRQNSIVHTKRLDLQRFFCETRGNIREWNQTASQDSSFGTLNLYDTISQHWNTLGFWEWIRVTLQNQVECKSKSITTRFLLQKMREASSRLRFRALFSGCLTAAGKNIAALTQVKGSARLVTHQGGFFWDENKRNFCTGEGAPVCTVINPKSPLCCPVLPALRKAFNPCFASWSQRCEPKLPDNRGSTSDRKCNFLPFMVSLSRDVIINFCFFWNLRSYNCAPFMWSESWRALVLK